MRGEGEETGTEDKPKMQRWVSLNNPEELGLVRTRSGDCCCKELGPDLRLGSRPLQSTAVC